MSTLQSPPLSFHIRAATDPDEGLPVFFGAGETVMEAAVRSGVDAVYAECGGACICATCCVILTADDFARFDPPTESELALLELNDAAADNPHARLSCQLVLKPSHAGMVVSTPASQN